MLKDDIVKILLELLNHVDYYEELRPPQLNEYVRILHYGHPNQSFAFKLKAFNLLSEIIELVVGNHNNNSLIVSEKYLEEQFSKIIVDTIKDVEKNKNNILNKHVGSLLKSLKGKTFICYIPINRIILNQKYEYSNFKLIPINNQIKDHFQDIGIQYDEFLESDIQGISKENVNSCLAEIKVICVDQKSAEIESFRIIDNFLNILRVFNKSISFNQEFRSGTNYIICYCLESDELSSSTSALDNSFVYPPLNYDDIVKSFPVDKIIEYKSQYPIFRNIRNAMMWLGHSNIVNHDYEILLMRITALESLLLKENENSGGKNLISERGAFILGGDYSEKDKISSFLSYSYELRSKVVHGERDIVIPDYLLERLNNYCCEIIIKVVNSDVFQSINDIKNYCHDMKFGKV